MALRYLCDQCKEVKLPEEMYGQGVFAEGDQGRPMVWEEPADGEYGLSVLPFIKGSDQHVCKSCVLGMLREMVEELSGEGEEGDESFLEPLTVADMVKYEEQTADDVVIDPGVRMPAAFPVVRTPGMLETWPDDPNELAELGLERERRYAESIHRETSLGEHVVEPTMIKHRDMIMYPHFPGLNCTDPNCWWRGAATQQEVPGNGQDSPGSDRASDPVPELRPVEAVQEPRADDSPSRLEDPLHFDDNCICFTIQRQGIDRVCPARVHRPR